MSIADTIVRMIETIASKSQRAALGGDIAALRKALDRLETRAEDVNGTVGASGNISRLQAGSLLIDPQRGLYVVDPNTGQVANALEPDGDVRIGELEWNHTLGRMELKIPLHLQEQDAAPGTPNTGYGVLYAENDKLYFKNDAGVVVELGGSNDLTNVVKGDQPQGTKQLANMNVLADVPASGFFDYSGRVGTPLTDMDRWWWGINARHRSTSNQHGMQIVTNNGNIGDLYARTYDWQGLQPWAKIWNAVNDPHSARRGQFNLTGGGWITYDNSGYFKWTQRFIVMQSGRGTYGSASGYWDITLPAAGTTVTGVGGAGNRTVAAGGILLNQWEGLYYILPINGGSASVATNFRVVGYTTDYEIPASWILLAIRNGDNGVVTVASTRTKLTVGHGTHGDAPVGAVVRHSGNWSGTDYVLGWDTAVWNPVGMWASGANTRLTILVSGMYWLCANVIVNHGGASQNGKLYIQIDDGTLFAGGRVDGQQGQNERVPMSASGLTYLTAGSYVNVRYVGVSMTIYGTNASLDSRAWTSNFSAHLVKTI